MHLFLFPIFGIFKKKNLKRAGLRLAVWQAELEAREVAREEEYRLPANATLVRKIWMMMELLDLSRQEILDARAAAGRRPAACGCRAGHLSGKQILALMQSGRSWADRRQRQVRREQVPPEEPTRGQLAEVTDTFATLTTPN